MFLELPLISSCSFILEININLKSAMSWSSQGVTDCWREMFLVEDELKKQHLEALQQENAPKIRE